MIKISIANTRDDTLYFEEDVSLVVSKRALLMIEKRPGNKYYIGNFVCQGTEFELIPGISEFDLMEGLVYATQAVRDEIRLDQRLDEHDSLNDRFRNLPLDLKRKLLGETV